MVNTQPTPQQLLAGLVTTTLFEAVGLFSGAVLIALSRQLGEPTLGVIGLLVWFLALWAENYSVSDIAHTRFNLSKPLSIFAMSMAEFATWTIWLVVLLPTGLHGLILLVLLALITQVHHVFQFGFFYPDAPLIVGFRSPILWAASIIEAIAGQGIIQGLLVNQDLTFAALAVPLVGLLILFTVEHIVGGQVKV